jgi:exosortase
MTGVAALQEVVAEESTLRLSLVAMAARIAYLAAFMPLTTAYYGQLWNLPNYQFFPWAWLGAGVLAWRGWKESAASRTGSVLVKVALIATSLFVLAAAVFLESPWLACVALFIALAALAYDAAGSAAFVRYGPAAFVLLTTLRPPLGADVALIAALQRITARAAGGVLDILDVTHYLAGNVIVVPGRRLLVEEACSGVNSLFSAGCGTLFYLLWCRRGWLSSLILLASVPIWVVVANTFRVAATAVLRVRFDVAADEGRLHDALGLAVFGLAMALIVSTERLFYFYSSLLEKDDEPVTKPTAVVKSTPIRTSRLFIAATFPALVLGTLQLPAVVVRWQESNLEQGAIQLPELGGEFVAKPAAAWQDEGFELVRRDRGSAFGERSQTWTFEHRDARAIVSLDYPFVGWHELTECYQMQGWQVESRRIEEGSGLPLVEVELSDPRTREFGLLLFCLVDHQGMPLSPRRHGELDEFSDRLSTRARRFFDLGARRLDESVTYQWQLHLAAYHRPSEQERADLRRTLREAVTRIRNRLAEPSVSAVEKSAKP